MHDASRMTRVEAYSDGIFAIASTLLILEIRVPPFGPEVTRSELWRGLADLWPSYLAFVLSFATIFAVLDSFCPIAT